MFLASLEGAYCVPPDIGFQLEPLLHGVVLVWPVPFPNGEKLSALKKALAFNDSAHSDIRVRLIFLIIIQMACQSILL